MPNLLPILTLLVAPHLQPAPPPKPMLWLTTKTYAANRPGGDSSSSAKFLELNQPTAFVTYRPSANCGFTALAALEIDPTSTLDWSVTAVPKVITKEHVVIDVTWIRQRLHKIEARGALTVLVRPGDRVTLDVADTREPRGLSCEMNSAELSLELDSISYARFGTRIVSTDMWLVRRLGNGQEQTQQLNVRSSMNEEVPFYFEDAKSGDVAMSVLGKIRPRERSNGTLALEFWAERQVRNGAANLGRGSMNLSPGQGLLNFDTDQDVVSVEFPISTNPTWKDLGSDKWSIRIRTKRIR